MGSLTVIFILELITGFIAFFFVDKVSPGKTLIRKNLILYLQLSRIITKLDNC